MVGDASKRRLFAAAFDNALALLVAVLPAAKLPGISDTLRWTMAVVICLGLVSCEHLLQAKNAPGALPEHRGDEERYGVTLVVGAGPSDPSQVNGLDSSGYRQPT